MRAALERIARWIVPDPHQPTRYDIEPYDASIHMSPSRKNRKDVLFSIDVIPRQGVDSPVDVCQTSGLKEIETKPRDLGAANREWSNRPAVGSAPR